MKPTRLIGGGFLVVAAVVTLLTLLGLPLGPAPFQLAPLGPPPPPIVVEVAVSSELEPWLNESLARFAASAPMVGRAPIEVRLNPRGNAANLRNTLAASVASANAVIVPSSSDVAALASAGIATVSAQPLLSSPLVAVAWRTRSDALWPQGPGQFWAELQQAASDPQGWASYGHSEWGSLKLGITSPEVALSGQQVLALAAYAFAGSTNQPDPSQLRQADYQTWLRGLLAAVPQYDSDETQMLADLLRFGPSRYDLAFVPEYVAIRQLATVQQRSGELAVFYPPATLASEPTFVVLASASREQQAAAALFRDFLLAEAQQESALIRYHWRPAAAQAASLLNSERSPFRRLQAFGLQSSLPPALSAPSPAFNRELLLAWPR